MREGSRRSGRHARSEGVLFVDRTDAGRRLAERLRHLAGQDVVVVGLPRGGVQVALEVALALNAPLDVIVVRKLGVPFQPELAMGAIGEGDTRVLNADVVAALGLDSADLDRAERRERAELERRSRLLRLGRVRVPLAGRPVVVVDDGVATGATARAACQVARAEGAARVVLAVPVAPIGWRERFAGVADELVCVATPDPFDSIGRSYTDFAQLGDTQVQDLLTRADARSDVAGPGTIGP